MFGSIIIAVAIILAVALIVGAISAPEALSILGTVIFWIIVIIVGIAALIFFGIMYLLDMV